MIKKEDVIEVLKTCYDPEIPVNIYDLGLVYGIDIEDNKVKVTMTLTAPGCPMHSVITREVQKKLEKLKGVDKAEVNYPTLSHGASRLGAWFRAGSQAAPAKGI